MSSVVRLDRLVGRRVYASHRQYLGRLEEFRAERRDGRWVIVEYEIGIAGLMDRLGLGLRLILGTARKSGYIARWDQLDLTNPDELRITCAVAALRKR